MATTPGVVWSTSSTGNFGSDKVMDRSVPAGVTNSGPLVSAPSRSSLIAGNFLDTSFGLICSLNCGEGSIIQVDATWQLHNNLTPVTIAPTATVIGTYFYPALDGVASNKLVPLGLPTSH